MGIFRAGLPLVRRAVGFFVGRGQYVPSATRVNAAGETVVEREEVVVPKGILWSKTIWMLIVAGFFRLAQSNGWDLWFDEQQAIDWYPRLQEIFVTLAGVFRVTAWMPTRGPAIGAPGE